MIASTSRQLQVLRAIQRHQDKHGFPASTKELGAVLGIRSTKGVFDHLAALQRKQLVTRVPNTARTLHLTPAGIEALRLGTAPSDSSPVAYEATSTTPSTATRPARRRARTSPRA